MRDRKYLNVRLQDSWSREYQVLHNRTHPLMYMDSASGYLLTGFKVAQWSLSWITFEFYGQYHPPKLPKRHHPSLVRSADSHHHSPHRATHQEKDRPALSTKPGGRACLWKCSWKVQIIRIDAASVLEGGGEIDCAQRWRYLHRNIHEEDVRIQRYLQSHSAASAFELRSWSIFRILLCHLHHFCCVLLPFQRFQSAPRLRGVKSRSAFPGNAVDSFKRIADRQHLDHFSFAHAVPPPQQHLIQWLILLYTYEKLKRVEGEGTQGMRMRRGCLHAQWMDLHRMPLLHEARNVPEGGLADIVLQEIGLPVRQGSGRDAVQRQRTWQVDSLWRQTITRGEAVQLQRLHPDWNLQGTDNHSAKD